jgi:hypothetical protein
MATLRAFVALCCAFFLCRYPDLLQGATNAPVGILTHARNAKLNSALAYPGLSVFEGEALSTTAEGKLGTRWSRCMWPAPCCGRRARQREPNPRCERCSPWCCRFPQFTAT